MKRPGKRRRVILLRPVAAGVLAALLAVVIACGGRTVVERRVIEYPTAPSDSARSWEGHTRETLEKVWGRPASTSPDGEGGVILTFHSSGPLTVKESRGGASISTSAGEVPMTSGTETERKREAGRFWIGPDGIIYRYWMQAALFESGEKDPPGVGPGFEDDEDQ